MKKLEEIKLSKILKEKFIHLGLKGNSKKEIVAELVDLISQGSRIRKKKVIFKAIMERERLGSTGIGNGVAIPHVKLSRLHTFILIFARKDEGVDFGALDGEKTYIFFTLASPEKEVGAHLKILAEISRLVADKFILSRLKKAKDAKEIMRIVSSFRKE
ncbi:MAG: PTS sugar transporter subunit IIA [Candidatus Omnitrophica bacterium]|nr:PTS sugar transporter subunit IIA [Candidatus Omnitrophota bacterium]MBI5144809.1 PTS sugar transporter subunit IIA [Candidatus Omnitrophota bacterium]